MIITVSGTPITYNPLINKSQLIEETKITDFNIPSINTSLLQQLLNNNITSIYELIHELIDIAEFFKLEHVNIPSIKTFNHPITSMHVSKYLQKQNGSKWILNQLNKNLTKSEFITEIGHYRTITNNDLKHAHHIKKLDATDCSRITSIAPFAETLEELNASDDCGISDISLINACKIKILDANNNHKITSVEPFAKTLEELDAGYDCGISDASLVNAHKIKKIVISEQFQNHIN